MQRCRAVLHMSGRAGDLVTTLLCRRTGKLAHRHRAAAVRLVREIEVRYRCQGRRVEVLGVYRCGACACWHVGHADVQLNRMRVRFLRGRVRDDDDEVPGR